MVNRKMETQQEIKDALKIWINKKGVSDFRRMEAILYLTKELEHLKRNNYP